MNKPIKREVPELDLSWTETIIMTIIACIYVGAYLCW